MSVKWTVSAKGGQAPPTYSFRGIQEQELRDTLADLQGPRAASADVARPMSDDNARGTGDVRYQPKPLAAAPRAPSAGLISRERAPVPPVTAPPPPSSSEDDLLGVMSGFVPPARSTSRQGKHSSRSPSPASRSRSPAPAPPPAAREVTLPDEPTAAGNVQKAAKNSEAREGWEVADLKRRCAWLEEQFSLVRQSHESLDASHSELQTKHASACTVLAKLKEDHATTVTEKLRFQDDCLYYRRAASKAVEEATAQRRTIEELKATVMGREATLAQLREEVARTTGKVAFTAAQRLMTEPGGPQVVSALQSLQLENSTLSQEAASLRAAMAASDAAKDNEIRRLAAELERSKGEAFRLNELLSSLRSQSEDSAKRWANDFNKILRESADLKRAMGAARQEAEGLVRTIGKREERIADLEQQLKGTASHNRKLGADVETLASDIAKLTASLKEVKQHAEKCEVGLKDASFVRDQYRAENDLLLAEVKQCRQAVAEAMSERDKALADAKPNRDLQGKAAIAMQMSQEITAEREGFKKSLESLKQAHAKELEKLKAQHAGDMAKAKQEWERDGGAAQSRLQQELSRVRDECAQVMRERDRAQASLASLAADCARLNTEVATVTSDLEAYRREMDSADSVIGRLKEQQRALKDELASTRATNEELSREHFELKGDAAAAESIREELHRRLASMSADRNELEERLSFAQEEHVLRLKALQERADEERDAASQAHHAELKQLREQHNSQLQALQQRRKEEGEAADARLAALEQEASSLSAALAEAQEQASRNETALRSDLEQEHRRLQAKLADAEAKVRSLTEQKRDLEDQRNALLAGKEAAIASASAAAAQASEREDSLKRQLAELKAGLEKASQLARTAQEDIAHSNERVQALTSQNLSLEADKERLDGLVAQLRREAESSKAELTQQVGSLEAASSASQERIAQLEGELAALLANNAVLLSESQQAREAFEAQKASLESELAASQQACKRHEQLYAEAADKVKALTGQLAVAQAELDAAKQTAEAKASALQTTEEEVAAAKKRIAELQVASANQSEQLVALRNSEASLQTAQESLSVGMSDLEASNNVLKQMVTALEGDLEASKDELQRTSSALRSLQATVEEYRRIANEGSAEAAELRQSAAELEKSSSSLAAENEGLRREVSTLSSAKANLEGQVAALTGITSGFTEQFASATKRNNELSDALAEQKVLVASLQAELQNSSQQKAEAGTALQALLNERTKEIETLTAAKDEAARLISTLRAECAALKEANRTLFADLEASKASASASEAAAATALLAATAAVGKADSALTSAQAEASSRIQALEKEAAALQSLVSELRNSLGQVQSALDDRNAALETSNADKASLAAKVEALELQLGAAKQAAAADTDEKVKALQAALAAKAAELEASAATLASVSTKLAETVKAQQVAAADAEAAKATVASHQADLIHAQAQLAKVTAASKEKEAELAAAKQQVSQLSAQLQTTSDELSGLRERLKSTLLESEQVGGSDVPLSARSELSTSAPFISARSKGTRTGAPSSNADADTGFSADAAISMLRRASKARRATEGAAAFDDEDRGSVVSTFGGPDEGDNASVADAATAAASVDNDSVEGVDLIERLRARLLESKRAAAAAGKGKEAEIARLLSALQKVKAEAASEVQRLQAAHEKAVADAVNAAIAKAKAEAEASEESLVRHHLDALSSVEGALSAARDSVKRLEAELGAVKAELSEAKASAVTAAASAAEASSLLAAAKTEAEESAKALDESKRALESALEAKSRELEAATAKLQRWEGEDKEQQQHEYKRLQRASALAGVHKSLSLSLEAQAEALKASLKEANDKLEKAELAAANAEAEAATSRELAASAEQAMASMAAEHGQPHPFHRAGPSDDSIYATPGGAKVQQHMQMQMQVMTPQTPSADDGATGGTNGSSTGMSAAAKKQQYLDALAASSASKHAHAFASPEEEVAHLRAQLTAAREKIWALQVQVQAVVSAASSPGSTDNAADEANVTSDAAKAKGDDAPGSPARVAGDSRSQSLGDSNAAKSASPGASSSSPSAAAVAASVNASVTPQVVAAAAAAAAAETKVSASAEFLINSLRQRLKERDLLLWHLSAKCKALLQKVGADVSGISIAPQPPALPALTSAALSALPPSHPLAKLRQQGEMMSTPVAGGAGHAGAASMGMTGAAKGLLAAASDELSRSSTRLERRLRLDDQQLDREQQAAMDAAAAHVIERSLSRRTPAPRPVSVSAAAASGLGYLPTSDDVRSLSATARVLLSYSVSETPLPFISAGGSLHQHQSSVPEVAAAVAPAVEPAPAEPVAPTTAPADGVAAASTAQLPASKEATQASPSLPVADDSAAGTNAAAASAGKSGLSALKDDGFDAAGSLPAPTPVKPSRPSASPHALLAASSAAQAVEGVTSVALAAPASDSGAAPYILSPPQPGRKASIQSSCSSGSDAESGGSLQSAASSSAFSSAGTGAFGRKVVTTSPPLPATTAATDTKTASPAAAAVAVASSVEQTAPVAYSIRPATLSDAPALVKLKIQTFRETFVDPPSQGGFGIPYIPEDLAAFEKQYYDLAVVEEELKGGKDGKTRVWVVEAASEGQAPSLAGYLQVETVKLPHPEVSTAVDEGEVGQLYLLRPHQGSGLGKRLMDLALSHIESAYGPEKRIWIGVWNGNIKAQRFYERYGFSKVGEYYLAVGNYQDHEYIYRREPKVTTIKQDVTGAPAAPAVTLKASDPVVAPAEAAEAKAAAAEPQPVSNPASAPAPPAVAGLKVSTSSGKEVLINSSSAIANPAEAPSSAAPAAEPASAPVPAEALGSASPPLKISRHTASSVTVSALRPTTTATASAVVSVVATQGSTTDGPASPTRSVSVGRSVSNGTATGGGASSGGGGGGLLISTRRTVMMTPPAAPAPAGMASTTITTSTTSTTSLTPQRASAVSASAAAAARFVPPTAPAAGVTKHSATPPPPPPPARR